MQCADVPWILGTTSKVGGAAFDVVAFSLSIVQEMLNLAPMLQRSSIPLSKRERMDDASIPLVILGGASALYTSMLFEDDPIVDGIFIGGDCKIIAQLFDCIKSGRQRGMPKRTILEELAELPGFFEPDKRKGTTVFHGERLLPAHLLESGPVVYETELIGKGNLQLSEGCSCFCSFCAESYARKPYREFSAQDLQASALRMKQQMGVDTCELYSFNFNMYRSFYPLLFELAGHFPTIGLKSQRFDSIAHDPELVKCLHSVGKSSITCGVEGISPRLRSYLQKNLNEDELRRSLATLLAAPLRELKVFLIATGLEQEEDYAALRDLLAYMQTVLRHANRRPRVIFSMTILVRFPWTPLEFADALPPAHYRKVLNQVEQIVRIAAFEFRAAASPDDYWLSQCIVRATDSNLGVAIRAALEETGYIYYRELTGGFVAAVKKQLHQSGLIEGNLLRAVPIDERSSTPWARLQTGVSETFLRTVWESSLRSVDIGMCAGTRTEPGACLGCDACADGETKAAVTSQPALRAYSLQQLKHRIDSVTNGKKVVRFIITVGERLRGLPKKYRALVLARALMLVDPALVAGFYGYESLGGDTPLTGEWLGGDYVVALFWREADAQRLETLLLDDAFIGRVNSVLGDWALLRGGGSTHGAVQVLRMTTSFTFDFTRYCRATSLTHTALRRADGGMDYILSKDARKKKILSSCSAMLQTDGTVTVTLVPGPKFNPEGFAQTAFTLPKPDDWVKVAMQVVLAVTADRVSAV